MLYSLRMSHICKSKETSRLQNSGKINEGLNYEKVKVNEGSLEGGGKKTRILILF